MANKILKYVKRSSPRPLAEPRHVPRTVVSMHLPGRPPARFPFGAPVRPRVESEF